MSTDQRVAHGRATAEWLALREPADAAARSRTLVHELTVQLSARRAGGLVTDPVVVHDLGSGTGSMRRWLSPRLPWPQHWVEHDRDGELAEARPDDVPAALIGSEARLEPTSCHCELADLTAGHLATADLITCSALLDVLTEEAADRLVAVAARRRVPMLLTLTVVGRVALDPVDPLDEALRTAFDDHQRRRTPAGRLLGPDAVPYLTARLARGTGAMVRTEPSPWQLGPSSARLAAAWLHGWLAAAVDSDPALAEAVAPYRGLRRAQLAARSLLVTVEHADLLVWWP